MNEVLQAIKNRRSIRKFKPDAVAKSDIEQILEAGIYAPSGMGRQATKVIAVTNPQLRSQFSEANREIGGWKEGFDPFYGAPVILVVLADAGVPTARYDGSLVMENMMLAAESLGLGSIWIHRAKEEFERDEFKMILTQLGIEGEWEGIGHVAVGYADDAPKAAERKADRIYWCE